MSDPKPPITLEAETPPLERLAKRFQAGDPDPFRTFTKAEVIKAFRAGGSAVAKDLAEDDPEWATMAWSDEEILKAIK